MTTQVEMKARRLLELKNAGRKKNLKVQRRIAKKRRLELKDCKLLVMNARHVPRSRTEYWTWWDRVEPFGIPRNPDRVYKDWVTWADFLDTDNEFCAYEKGVWRKYFDAMRYVHSRKLENKPAYKEAVLGSDWPKDIPKSPQTIYAEWDSWSTWLGITLRSRMNVMTEVKQCMAICTIGSMSANVVRVLIARGGIDDLRTQLEDAGNLKVYKMYGWSSDDGDVLSTLMARFASDQGGGEYIVHNMPSLLFELDSVLAWWK